MKVEELVKVTFDESPLPTKLLPLVDDDVGEEESIKKNTRVVNNKNEEDESIEVDEVVNIKEFKNHPLDQVIGNLNQRTLRFEDFKPTKTPMLTEINLTKDNEADFMDSSKYQGNPKTTHLEAVKRIFRYIRGTTHLGLWYLKGTRIETIVYADSNHAGDYIDRKSTNGVCMFMRCCLISWFAKKQTTLAISMTEAKYLSVRKACQQALWMKQALIDYDIRLDDVLIMCDNKGATDLNTFYTSERSLNSLYDHPNSNFFGPKHDLIRNNITIPITTQTQLQRSPNKLHINDIHPNLRGWELFFRDNFFCSFGKKNKVNACTACMLYYLTIRRKFNFTSMIIYQMEEVINKRDGPIPFAMLLTRLYNHILQTNPQTIVPTARFTFHECVINPLDISKILANKRERKLPLNRSPPLHLHRPMTMKHHPFSSSMMNYSKMRILPKPNERK
uniref:Copia protein n=1 Tax=Tanacetum cinerariifolium TaxID=118510 RepID=A0A6L2JSA9_TANCI|nr:hypothetical protein [Tanacetum cinerariifolium]